MQYRLLLPPRTVYFHCPHEAYWLFLPPLSSGSRFFLFLQLPLCLPPLFSSVFLFLTPASSLFFLPFSFFLFLFVDLCALPCVRLDFFSFSLVFSSSPSFYSLLLILLLFLPFHIFFTFLFFQFLLFFFISSFFFLSCFVGPSPSPILLLGFLLLCLLFRLVLFLSLLSC